MQKTNLAAQEIMRPRQRRALLSITAAFFSIIAHCGLGLLIISIALNDNLSSERALNIKINETEVYKDHQINFKNLRVVPGPNFDSVKADFVITSPNGKVFILTPEKRKYFIRGQITSESAIKITPLKDIYMTLGDQLDNGYWVVNIQYNFLFFICNIIY